jgi:hypothetical protein
MAITEDGPISWERMIGARDKVQRRLDSSTACLRGAVSIPHAVIGGNAVAAWVSTIDPDAVRGTPNVDLLIDRANLSRAMTAILNAGFVQAFGSVADSFLESPNSRPNSRIRLFFAGERISTRCERPLPRVTDSMRIGRLDVISLESLVEMKLVAHRTIDRVHLRDMIDVGLIDATWTSTLPAELGSRLQQLLNTPDG